MLVSVFTPSHDTQFLDECYGSLKKQTYTDWEWIVILNGGAKWNGPKKKDRRVKVALASSLPMGVGAAKGLACEQATGEILLELDHDDLLASTAIQEVVAAFDENPDVGFVYSDCAQISADGSRDSSTFDVRHGWEYREEVWGAGLTLQPVSALEPYPHNVSYIWYAPNHLRAFRREVYDKVGGYDAAHSVLDDQDLMCRLYQQTRFLKLPRLLYAQRVHDGSTQKGTAVNAEIQLKTVTLYDQYVQKNALAWAEREGLLALDLGSAHGKPEGYEGVDTVWAEDVNHLGDIFDVLAEQADNSVGVIRAVDFLEHIPDKVRLFNEFYRVLAHGGMLLSLTPSTDGRGAYQDPTHVAFYNENSFWYFTDESFAQYVRDITCRFQVSRLVTSYPSQWHEEHNISYVTANLIAIKQGSRQGGFLHWNLT